MVHESISALPAGAFDGRAAFAARLRAALAAAAGQGWREMVFSDPDFADWPLGEQAVIDALQTWAQAGRSLSLLARHFDAVERRHARFVHWRRRWDHLVQARMGQGPHGAEVPSALWTPTWCLHRIDPVRSRGVCGTSGEERVALRHLLDECFQQGRPGFAASVLGL